MGDLGGESRQARREPLLVLFPFVEVKTGLAFHFVTVDMGVRFVGLKKRPDGVVSSDLSQVNKGGLDEFLIDAAAVSMLWNIALGLAQLLDEEALLGIAEKILRQLGGAPGVLNYLDGFNSRQFIEEPAATCIHQHGVSLELQELPHGRFLGLFKLPDGVPGEKRFKARPERSRTTSM